LLLGAGGAARGVMGPLLAAAPECIVIANRHAARAVELAEEFALLGTVLGCEFENVNDDAVFDLVLNATSASLQDEIPPIPRRVIGPATLCYDMAYGKGDTSFTRWAKSNGAGRAETGWGMLVEQAAEAFLLWRGVKPNTKAVLEAIKAQA
jgi:shikimate dehydrogenase